MSEPTPRKGFVVRHLNGWLLTSQGGSGLLKRALVFKRARSAELQRIGEAIYSIGAAEDLDRQERYRPLTDAQRERGREIAARYGLLDERRTP